MNYFGNRVKISNSSYPTIALTSIYRNHSDEIFDLGNLFYTIVIFCYDSRGTGEVRNLYKGNIPLLFLFCYNVKMTEKYMKNMIKGTNPKDEIFLDFFNELGLYNKDIPIEGNVRQGIIGHTDVIVCQGEDDELIIESIRTDVKERGSGSARNALEKIIDSANKRKIKLKIKIVPEDSINTGLGIPELKMFYEKRGFVFNDKNEGVRISQ